MLSTPKIPDSANSLMSPKFLAYTTSTRGSNLTNGTTSHSGSTRATSNGDDMLMTPIMMTPNTVDAWSSRRSAETEDFSPENLSPTNDVELGPREPPKDLPMDSDIGLRSPCDGLLAKRRKQMREMNKRPGSFNSDSNSCDTPTSENSPRDLTTGPPRNGIERHRHPSPVNSNNNNNSASESSPTASSTRSFDPSSPRNLPPLLPPPPLGSGRYEDFKKPANLMIHNSSIKENDLPAHYNPSPLAVPSPNWSAVERYFGGELIKTPKNLDSNFFDFLGPPPPGTPRSANRIRDRSPNHPVDCYSGRDQRLSPRLSPRFPIPEAPTDLSGRPPPLAKPGELIGSNEAQDLSTRGSKSRMVQNSTPPQISPPSVVVPTIIQSSATPTTTPVKIEYPRLHTLSTSPDIPTTITSRMNSRCPSFDETCVPLRVAVKSETPITQDASPYNDNNDYCNQMPHIPPPPQPCYPNSFYLPTGFQPGYHRHIYGLHHDVERPSPPRTASPARPPFERPSYHGHQGWAGMPQHQNHHLNLQHHLHQQHQHDLHMQHGSSGGGLMINPHAWTTPVKEEVSLSPPPLSIIENPHFSSMKLKSTSALLDGMMERKKAPRKNSGDVDEKRGRKKGKAKIKKEAEEQALAPGESKRQYVCQHCQRSYDWNYNLNRHLKYECGKENAFQCAKCGRKFPHKQNCVYHLKRKHKVVLETIDQYMSAGLVIFRGASDPTGHTEARPVTLDG